MTAAAPLRFTGLPVELGGVQYTMPPLSARAARLYWPRMQAMQRGEEPEPLQLAAEVVHACLARNYPDLSQEQVEDLVDLGNSEELLAKAGGSGSFKRWCDQQRALAIARGETPGNEVPQPQPTPDGTGAPSTPQSPPPPAGASATSTS
jgi:hypothetical protein